MTRGAPDWARDAVFYQVFPDRFAASARVAKPGPLEPWDAEPTHHGYKGGDLLGLAERLEELADLGVTGIYLNPVFSAASNHRYNAYDYFRVDPLLGGNDALRELLDAAHHHGMRVLLDGVFNHVGRGFWPFHHVLESGGASPYRDWFYLDRDVPDGHAPLHAYGDDAPRGYRGWWGVPSLPKLRVEHPDVRAHLMAVAEHWTRFGIDGWRLDVPLDIEDPTFWPEFRERVRAINPEAYIVGEVWDPAPHVVQDGPFDAVMNYPLGVAILGFVGGDRLDRAVIDGQSNYQRELWPLDGGGFAAALGRLAEVYPPDVAGVQYNVIGSHDTPRAVSVLGGDAARLRLAMTLHLTLPGTPSIYYGDELAMAGGPDPGCRGGYPAQGVDPGEAARTTRAAVRSLIAARRGHLALRRGSVTTVAVAARAVALERSAGTTRAVVAVNAGDDACELAIDARVLVGLAPVMIDGMAGGSADVGAGVIRVPALGAVLLVSD